MRILVYIIRLVVDAIAFTLLVHAFHMPGEHPGALIGAAIMYAGFFQSTKGLVTLVIRAIRSKHK